ncbi:MAG: winged helix-turn-helix transcriptional regulator [Candidatus Thorarchaeota archaeon]
MKSNVQYASRVKDDVQNCPVYITSQILGKAWTILILQTLMALSSKEGLRFNEIQRDLSWVSPKILSQRLKELVGEGIISRNIDSSEMPLKVTYTLTRKGEDLRGVLTLMQKWGVKHNQESRKRCKSEEFSACEGCREIT